MCININNESGSAKNYATLSGTLIKEFGRNLGKKLVNITGVSAQGKRSSFIILYLWI